MAVEILDKKMDTQMPIIFEMSGEGRGRRDYLPDCDVPLSPMPAARLLRDPKTLLLPDVGEPEVVEYFTVLSNRNLSIDNSSVPLGSCTMKYNSETLARIASINKIARTHPYQPVETVQGNLMIYKHYQDSLMAITGMEAVAISPLAGAQGELTGILMVKKYHESRGEDKRKRVLIPDSAHGSNPATAAMAGFDVEYVKTNDKGNVDLDDLQSKMGDDVAALMMTIPSTLGLFDPNILKITKMVHEGGAIMYGDGANLNALLGIVKPGDLGIDVMHINPHKTFSTPHGGGGPGSGPVLCKEFLASFLPNPIVAQDGDKYLFVKPENSIGRMGAFHGNFMMAVWASAYIDGHGPDGLRVVAEDAVLNANYLLALLRDEYKVPYNRRFMHEIVLAGLRRHAPGITTMDVAKRLIDLGFYPPTVYFPSLVPEALMIEPTETESKRSLEAMAAAYNQIAREARNNPQLLFGAPHAPENAYIGRLDVAAASHPKTMKLVWTEELAA